MATPANLGRKLIRCPVCLATQEIAANANPLANVVCVRCKRHFRVMGALTAAHTQPAHAPAEKLRTAGVVSHASAKSAKPAKVESAPLAITLPVGAAMILIAYTGAYLVGFFDGPDFLAVYFMVFFTALLVTSLLRWTLNDDWAYSIYGFLLFEGMGIARIYTSSHPGEKKYGFLVVGMIFGGMMFFLRAKSDGRGGYGLFGQCSSGGCGSGSCSSCGGGGGCGGGGCGGGGCGG